MTTLKKSIVFLLVLSVAAISSLYVLPVKAQSSSDNEVREEMDKLNKNIEKAQKSYDAIKRQLANKNKALQSAQASGKAKDSQIKSLKSQIAEQNKKLAAQEKRIHDLQTQLQTLRAQLQGNSGTPAPEQPDSSPSGGWNPQAICRITAFSYTPGDSCVKLTVEFKDGETEELEAPFGKTGQDTYFKIENIYAKTQVVMPVSSRGDWVVNVDSRSGYVAKIDPSNIEGSKAFSKKLHLFYSTIKLSLPAPVPMNLIGQPNNFFNS